MKQDTARHPRHWGWTLWEGKVKVGFTRKLRNNKLSNILPEKCKKNNKLSQVGEAGEVWSKAVDSSFNVQVFLTNKNILQKRDPIPIAA